MKFLAHEPSRYLQQPCVLPCVRASVRAPSCNVTPAVQLQVQIATSENVAGTGLHQLGYRGGTPHLFWRKGKHQRDGENDHQ